MSALKDRRGLPLVAVTGIGLVTPLGLGVAESWGGLRAGRSGIRRFRRFDTTNMKTGFGGEVLLPEEQAGAPLPASIRALRYSQMSAEEALAMAGLGGRGGFPGPLFLGLPPLELEWRQRMQLVRKSSPGYAAMLEAGAGNQALYRLGAMASVPTQLAEQFGTRGAPIGLSTACATGASATQFGIEAIQRGECEAALVISTESSITQEAVIRFGLLSALSTRNDDPAGASRPFDATRDGFVMAEGSGCLVLESLEHAKARGAAVLGFVLGAGERADNFHRTRGNPDGSAMIAAMQAAIADAGLEPGQIGYVNAHGTSTPENDKMECLALQAVFGEGGVPPVSSNKSMIGHTVSASGGIEAVASLLTIRDGVLPPTINHRTPDPAIPLDVVPNTPRDAQPRFVLSNSFGFGGQNVCLVLGAEPPA